jgi:allantoicase
VDRSAAKGDARNAFEVTDGHRYTHVRLSIYPDGGVARLRVHGEAVPDPVYAENVVRAGGCVYADTTAVAGAGSSPQVSPAAP